jgi:ATP-binding cassette subfamily F protein 3
MALLSLSDVSKSFGAELLFDNISFTVENNHKIGLVGVNGSGKTTLFKIICGTEIKDTGEIFKSKETNIGYVDQFACRDSNLNVFDELLTVKNDMIELENKINDLQKQIEKNPINLEELIEQKHKLDTEFEKRDGYIYRSIAKSTLIGLGFSEIELDQSVASLSGGQKTRLTLAKLLLSNSNLLLLDEPTNNLDISSIEWLENFLLSYKGSFIVISHDRYFLDRVTSETLELESKKLSGYKGNYTTYLSLKAEKNKMLSRKFEQSQKEISRIEGIIEQQKTWSQERNYKIIRNKQKSIDRIQAALEEPDKEMEKMKFHFKVIAGGNQEVLIVKNLTKNFGNKKIFENISLKVMKGENVFIIGPNGCGKTTLLKIIQDKLDYNDGYYEIGSNMKIAYYSQTGDELPENQTILEYIWNSHTKLTQTEVRNALATFLFKGSDVEKRIGVLSGGEKARVLLLMIMLSESNFLILDEPTNHLDIYSREALENALLEYDGTILAVSHDRYFINKLASKIYYLDKDRAIMYEGDYDNYIENSQVEDSVRQEKTRNTAYKEKKEKEAQERKQKNRIVKLEEAISKVEEEIQILEEKVMLPEYSTDYVKAMELTEKISEKKVELIGLYKEWGELQG